MAEWRPTIKEPPSTAGQKLPINGKLPRGKRGRKIPKWMIKSVVGAVIGAPVAALLGLAVQHLVSTAAKKQTEIPNGTQTTAEKSAPRSEPLPSPVSQLPPSAARSITDPPEDPYRRDEHLKRETREEEASNPIPPSQPNRAHSPSSGATKPPNPIIGDGIQGADPLAKACCGHTAEISIQIPSEEIPPKPTPSPKQQPPDPKQNKPIRQSGGVLQGKALQKREPVYPPIAKQARIVGQVVVEVTIDQQGRVTSARATSGHPMLKEAAVNAALGWTFTPTLLSGAPVSVIGTITFNFKL
jgi:TonB family protein